MEFSLITTDVKDEILTPSHLNLNQNYPNPFNPSTQISFSISKAGYYSLKVFNLLGEEVTNLLEDYLQPGSYSISFDGKELSSGIYIYTLFGGNRQLSKKMILSK